MAKKKFAKKKQTAKQKRLERNGAKQREAAFKQRLTDWTADTVTITPPPTGAPDGTVQV